MEKGLGASKRLEGERIGIGEVLEARKDWKGKRMDRGERFVSGKGMDVKKILEEG